MTTSYDRKNTCSRQSSELLRLKLHSGGYNSSARSKCVSYIKRVPLWSSNTRRRSSTTRFETKRTYNTYARYNKQRLSGVSLPSGPLQHPRSKSRHMYCQPIFACAIAPKLPLLNSIRYNGNTRYGTPCFAPRDDGTISGRTRGSR